MMAGPTTAAATTPKAALPSELAEETPVKDNTTTAAVGTGTASAEPNNNNIVTIARLNDVPQPASVHSHTDSLRSNDTMEYFSSSQENSIRSLSNNMSNNPNKLDRLQSNLMRTHKPSRDPMRIYQIVEILGEGSMGRVCRVHKRKAAVGGSARPDFVRRQKGCCFLLLGSIQQALFPSNRSKFSATTTTSEETEEEDVVEEEDVGLVHHNHNAGAQEIQTTHFFASKDHLLAAQQQQQQQLAASARSVSTFDSGGYDSTEKGVSASSSGNEGGRTFAAAAKQGTKPAKREPRSRQRQRRSLLYKKKSSLHSVILEQSKDVSYALKSIHLNRCTSPLLVQELKNEVDILRSLDHPNIVRAIETFDYRHRLYIVLELCLGGDLYTREPYSEMLAQAIATQVISAVAYLHSKGIVHRDLKFENIMFVNHTSNDIKLIDFGLSQKFASDEHLHDQVGTVYTMSPELLAGDYTSQADVWSLGVICFMLLSSSMPFYGHNRVSVIRKILKGKYRFSARKWSQRTEEARSFVAACLTMDPEQRPTAAECLHLHWMQMDFGEGFAGQRRTVKHCNTKMTPTSGLLQQQQQHTNGNNANPEPQAVVLSGASGLTATEAALEELDQMDRIQSSILAFATYSRIKKLALLIVAYKSTTEEIGYLKQMFDKFDIEHDGEITESEFARVLQEHYDYTDHEVSVMFQGIDVDGTGKVHYSEFLAATLEADGHVLDEDRLAEAFDRLDSDDSGYITLQDLRDFLGTEVPDFYLKDIIDEADLEGDHRISYEEFIQQWDSEENQNEIMSQVKSSVASRHILTPSHSFLSSMSDDPEFGSSHHSGHAAAKGRTSQELFESVENQLQHEHEQKQGEHEKPEPTSTMAKEGSNGNGTSGRTSSYRRLSSAPPVMTEAMEAATCFRTQKALSVRNAWV